MPATPVQTLADASACFTCLGISAPESFQLALWDLISQNIASDPVADFIARAGITDQTQIDAVTALHAAAVANGWWDQCELIYPFVGGTSQAHAQNLKSANFTIIWNGTVTHDANGITGDGTTGYGDTGYVPSIEPMWALDSAHLAVYRRTFGTTSNRCYMGSGLAGALSAINRSLAGTGLTGGINEVLINTTFTGAVSLALNMVTRLINTAKRGYSGAVDFSSATASTSESVNALYVLANNTIGATAFSNANLAGATVGSGITNPEFLVMAADWQTFNTSLGRQV